MKKIGFVGVFDKTDLILSISEIFIKTQKKVLFIDATSTQKSKYIIPNIMPTLAYMTEYQGIDVAIGFENLDKIKQYIGIDEDGSLDYDFIFVDVDDCYGFENFKLKTFDYLYYVTSFDAFSLKKGIEILHYINTPVRMSKIFFSKEMHDEEEEYFDYLSLGLKVEWEETKLLFLLENGDQAALIENQRLQEIKFKNLSNIYKENISYLANEIEPSISQREIKNIMKDL